MNDQELLAFVEGKLICKMLTGCEIDDHLGNGIDPCSWSVSFRADTISRLLDLAKAGIKGEA